MLPTAASVLLPPAMAALACAAAGCVGQDLDRLECALARTSESGRCRLRHRPRVGTGEHGRHELRTFVPRSARGGRANRACAAAGEPRHRERSRRVSGCRAAVRHPDPPVRRKRAHRVRCPRAEFIGRNDVVSLGRALALHNDAVWFVPLSVAEHDIGLDVLATLPMPFAGTDEPIGLIRRYDLGADTGGRRPDRCDPSSWPATGECANRQKIAKRSWNALDSGKT